MESKKVHVWVKQDSGGTYFVYGTYFFNERMGDIPLSRPYSQKEKNIKQMEDLQNQPLKNLKVKINKIAKSNGKKAIIQFIP